MTWRSKNGTTHQSGRPARSPACPFDEFAFSRPTDSAEPAINGRRADGEDATACPWQLSSVVPTAHSGAAARPRERSRKRVDWCLLDSAVGGGRAPVIAACGARFTGAEMHISAMCATGRATVAAVAICTHSGRRTRLVPAKTSSRAAPAGLLVSIDGVFMQTGTPWLLRYAVAPLSDDPPRR